MTCRLLVINLLMLSASFASAQFHGWGGNTTDNNGQGANWHGGPSWFNGSGYDSWNNNGTWSATFYSSSYDRVVLNATTNVQSVSSQFAGNAYINGGATLTFNAINGASTISPGGGNDANPAIINFNCPVTGETVSQTGGGYIYFNNTNTINTLQVAAGTVVGNASNSLGNNLKISNGASVWLAGSSVYNTDLLYAGTGTATLHAYGNNTNATWNGDINLVANSTTAQNLNIESNYSEGAHTLTFFGNTINLGTAWFQSLGTNVNNLTGSYANRTSLYNTNLNCSYFYVGRNAVLVQGNSNIAVSGLIQSSSDWATLRLDYGTTTATGGTDLCANGVVASQLEIYSGAVLATYFVRVGQYAGTNFYVNGGTLKATAGGTDFIKVRQNGSGDDNSGYMVIGNNGIAIDTNGFNTQINTQINDNPGESGSFYKQGAGTLYLTKQNYFTGSFFVQGGTVVMNGNSTFGAAGHYLEITNGSTLDLAGRSFSVSSINYPTAGLNGSVPNGTLTFAGASYLDTGSVGGVLAGAGSISKIGTGTFTLIGSNTYTGTTTVSSGTLALGHLFGSNSQPALAANAGTITVASGGTLRFDSDNNLGLIGATSGPDVVVNGGTVTNTGGYFNLLQNLTLNGGILTGVGGYVGYGSYAVRGTLTSTGTSQITIGTANNGALALSPGGTTTFQVDSGTLTVNASITNSFAGPGSLLKTGTGTLVLTTANTYSGGTTVNAGTLRVNGQTPTSGAVAVNSSGVLDGTGTIRTAAGIAAGGTLRGGVSGTGTLTLTQGFSTVKDSILAIKISAAGSPAAINTGGSTDLAALPNPTRNSFLEITGGTTTINSLTKISVDLSSLSMLSQPYSFEVMRGAGNQSGLNIPASQFTFLNGSAVAGTATLTGKSTGEVYFNFTPVAIPEPAFTVCISSLLLAAVLRRKK